MPVKEMIRNGEIKMQMTKEEILKIRNIGIAAHIDAGKTTTTERILYYAGRLYRMGEVDEGTTQMDYMIQEQERGITITSAATYCQWQDCNINIIDTPGHVDFTMEVERALRVLDSVVVIFSAVEGVEPQSETVWRQAERYKIPRLVYINKMDRVGANFFRVAKEIKKKLPGKPVIIQIPYGEEENFEGIIDLVEEKLILFVGDKGETLEKYNIPEDALRQVKIYRNLLLEAVIEENDELLEKYLEDEDLTIEDITCGIRSATCRAKMIPVLCGSSYKFKGVQPLLSAICDYLPSPLDLPDVRGINPQTGEKEERKTDINSPFSALAFKVLVDPYVGKLVFFRVYSGKVSAGSYIYNSTKDKKERLSRILRMHANKKEDVEDISAGQIAAAVGLNGTTTGDTLSCEKNPIILEKMYFPEPVIFIAIEPRTKADEEKMMFALHKLEEEDPTLKVRIDEETGQTIISGMGELHLEILVDRLTREFGVLANVGKPQVAYKETIERKVREEGRYIKQTGGRGQYGHVILEVSPNPPGCGIEFKSKIKGESIPRSYLPVIERGVKAAMEVGELGYPVQDVKVTLLDGSHHDVDSCDIAYKIATEIAIKKAISKAHPVLLEPVMMVEVTTPDDYLGEIIADLQARRSRITDMVSKDNKIQVIKSATPLSEMFGYATTLRSKSQGRATYTMQFLNYDKVPEEVAQKVLGVEE